MSKKLSLINEEAFNPKPDSIIDNISNEAKSSRDVDASDTTPLLFNSLPKQEDNLKSGNELKSKQTTTQKFKKHSYIYATILVGIVGGILFGYHLGIISGAILQMRDHFCLGIVESEVVVSALLAGAVVGSFTGGMFVDYIGRKVTIILDAFIFIIGTLIVTFSIDFWMLLVGRLVIGYAFSLSITVHYIYVSEIAPAKRRGMIVSFNQFGISLGIVVSYIVSHLFVGVHNGWRYMFGLSLALAIIQATFIIFLPKTPRYLLLKGKEEEAFRTLQKIRGKDSEVSSEFNEMKASIDEQKYYNWWNLFTLKDRMLLRMFIGCGITLFQQLSGQNCVLFYAPILFKVLGFSSNAGATMATIGVGAAKFLFSILNFFVIDTLGRRPLLLIGIFLLSASTLLLGTLTIVYIDPYLVLSDSQTQLSDCDNFTSISQSEYAFPTNTTFPPSVQTPITATKWISLVLFMIYVGGYEIGFGNIAWLLLTELFPPSVRGQAVSLCTTINWTMNLIVSLTLLSIYHSILGYTYILFGLSCIIAFVFVFFLVPETKKKSLERISEELKNKQLCSSLYCLKTKL